MKLDKKSIFLVGIFYGLITVVANGIGAIFSNFLKIPVMEVFYSEAWNLYMTNNSGFDLFINVCSFILPVILTSLMYTFLQMMMSFSLAFFYHGNFT